jgi:hypothetical protein
VLHRFVHKMIYVDNPVTFARDKTWTATITVYAGVLPIGNIAAFPLISPRYGDRSTIHSSYDYE